MFDAFLRFVLRQKLLMMLGAVLLIVAGAVAWQRLPIDAFPDVTNVQVMILADAPGLAPSEVERLITTPIELEMGGLPQVRQVRSLSRAGLAQVIIVFEDDVDTYFSRQLVFERLAQARDKLPPGIEPEMGPISTGLGEIYQYALESGHYCAKHPETWSRTAGKCPACGEALVASEYDLTGLRTLQDWLITPQLRRLEGVNEVNSFGGFVKQFHVEPDPDLLKKYDVSLREIMEALEANNANASGGYLVQDWEQMNVVSKGLVRDIRDIEQIVLKAEGGAPVYLRDVARVRIGHQSRNGVVTRDGRGEAVLGMAIMLKGANSKDVVDRVRAAIPEIQKSLPAGVRVTPFYDRTDLIEACIDTVSHAILEGVVLIVAILFLVLWDVRASLIVALLLPLTAAATFLLMGWQGVTANLMSLGGLAIAIGMVVDAAIVITENIARHMRLKADSALSRGEIAFDALKEVARPVIFAVLIILIVFLPLFSLGSTEGKMFKPLAITMCFALLGSLVISLTVVPALCALLVKRQAETERSSMLVRAIQWVYMPALRLSMRGRWITVAVAAACIIGALSVLPRIGTEFLPPLEEGSLAINVVRLPTASVEGSAKQATEIERRLLQKFPQVITTVVSKTGRAEIAEDPMGPEQSDLLIMLRPRKEWPAGLTKAGLVEQINHELAAIPGIRPAFSQPIALRVNELISGIKSDVAIKIFGDDMDELRKMGERVAPLLASVPGAGDVKIEQVSGFSQVEIEMNREAMSPHRINAADVNLLVETLGGKAATNVFEGQKRFSVVVRFPERYRDDLDAIRRLAVPSPAGYTVPLGQLAEVRVVEVPAQISREDSMRRIVVECNVRGRDIGSFVAEARAKLATEEKALPVGYHFTWGGQFENQQRAMARLKLMVPVAILLIFVLLFTSLGSVKSALLVMTNLSSAFVGGLLALFLLKINLSVSASIGFIPLFGADVASGLLLVSFFDQLRREGRSVHEAIFEACRLRIRPLMMTSLAVLLGLVPMLYATGSGSEIQKPMVAVIFGGMISSLALTLLVLPVLYALFNRERAAAEPHIRPEMEAAIAE